MTKDGIRDYLATLRSVYPSVTKLDTEARAAQVRALLSAYKDYSDRQINDALDQWIRSEKYQPTPSEIIKLADQMRNMDEEYKGVRSFWDNGCLMVYNPQTQLYEVAKRMPVDKSKWTPEQWEMYHEAERRIAEKEARKRAEQFEPTQVELDEIEEEHG